MIILISYQLRICVHMHMIFFIHSHVYIHYPQLLS